MLCSCQVQSGKASQGQQLRLQSARAASIKCVHCEVEDLKLPPGCCCACPTAATPAAAAWLRADCRHVARGWLQQRKLP